MRRGEGFLVKFSDDTVESLRNYVYIYRDPITGHVFYVGRGKGNRCFAHLDDSGESRKNEVINRLRTSGLEPIIDILRSGLSENQAKLLEASVIDLLGLNVLTNGVRGHHEGTVSRESARSIIEAQDAKRVQIQDRAILIRINREYRDEMSNSDLYDVTRNSWQVGPRSEEADYAMAVYRGIVKEVFKIHEWHKVRGSRRREFIGEKAPETVRKKYVGKAVRHYFGKGSQNPIKYVNI